MADILITGRISLLHNESLLNLAEDFRVILASTGACTVKATDRLKIYKLGPCEDGFGRLFDVYSFQTVFFISGYVDGGNGYYGDVQELDSTLQFCSSNGVGKSVIISSMESQNYISDLAENSTIYEKNYNGSVALKAEQMEQLALYYEKKNHLKTIILHLPYLIGINNKGFFLNYVLGEMKDGKKVYFPYSPQSTVDFLSENDLIRLLKRIVQEEEDISGSYYVCSGYQHTWGELETILKKFEPDVQIMYEDKMDSTIHSNYPVKLRKIYGWIPIEDGMADIECACQQFRDVPQNKKKNLLKIIPGFFNHDGRLLKYVELLVGFLAVEVLNQYLSASVFFNMVDVRLFFVVIIGTIYGIRLGLLAALLECISLFLYYRSVGVDWTLLFYNVENWIPFMVYIMAGTVTGYVKNKKTEEIKFAREEYELLREKYIFLNDVYKGAIENKGEYRKQILGFKDSFGRIFDAVQKLDNILPQGVFMEALDVMEDILENRSIAIYSVDKYERFGRLMVCSSPLRGELKKSLALLDFPEMLAAVKDGKVWKNSKFTENSPVYANGIFREGHLVMFVCLYNAQLHQYGMDYMNIFRILCGLVQTSFLRALEYMEAAEDKIYYPGTNIMKPDKFEEILEVQREMKDKGVADYILLHLNNTDRKYVSGELSQIIRTTDTIGERNNGNLYLLLTQVNEDSFHFVEERLSKTEITYKMAGKEN